ncbi:MAG TPA: DHA2 family efflux MFS transporter permease subunit [Gemmatimonadaceae bacterium]|nr:DHA2 family efflux MFS transporter permease subunit [Gemmatimonadaceae bacterium]
MATAAFRAAAIPAAPAASDADRYRHKYVIAIAVTLAATLELVDTSIVNVAIPHMMGNLGATLDEIAWVSVGYIIANVIVIPMSPWLSAYFGRRRYLAGSIALFIAASMFCGASSRLDELVFWRVIQGVGGGALLSTAQSTLWEAFPPNEVGIGQAMFGVGVMVGPTIGPTLGGWIVDNWSWPWIFYINLPLGIIAGALTWMYVRDSEHQTRAEKVDWLGIGLLTVAIGALQWMLERGERLDWFESPFIVTLGVTSVVALTLLVWHELTTDEPVIDFHILRDRQLATGVVMGGLLGFALFGSVFVLPVFLQSLHNFTANQTGMVILPGAIASAITMAILGKRLRSVPDGRPVIVVGALLFMVCMWQLAGLTMDSGKADLFWPLVSRGVGLGLIFIPLNSIALADLHPRDLAQGTGMFNLARQLGGSLGIAVMATLLARFTKEKKALLAEHLSVTTPDALDRLNAYAHGLMARGVNPVLAKQGAAMVMDRVVSVQASVLAFSRIYLISGVALLAALPLMLLWHSGRGRITVTRDAH